MRGHPKGAVTDRTVLSRATPAALRRLARFVGLDVAHYCEHPRCVSALVEAVARRLAVTL